MTAPGKQPILEAYLPFSHDEPFHTGVLNQSIFVCNVYHVIRSLHVYLCYEFLIIMITHKYGKIFKK